MHNERKFLHLAVALAIVTTPLGVAAADTGGPARGPLFERNISGTPALASSKAKIDGFQFYVPARTADGSATVVEYRDAAGRLVESRDAARPLLSVYIDDDADPVHGDDVWAAYSLDDGDTWARTNLSAVADRSSFTVGEGTDAERAYAGMVSKPALTLKGNRAVVAWTSTYCDSGFPGYEDLVGEDTHAVGGPQRSVDYTLQGFPEVGEVPYKCLWAARGLVDQGTGAMTWYQPERLTSGSRYAMQITANSAPGAGFVLAWGEDPAGLAPGTGSGPGEGWTGAHPNPGTDVWYSYLPMSSFGAVDTTPEQDDDDPAVISSRPQPAKTFSVPVPVSDNAPGDGEVAAVGATRPALGVAAYSWTKPDGSTGNGAWIAYGYEETKPGLGDIDDPESGKRAVHHAFDLARPDVDAAGLVVSPPGESARRVRYISQPYGQMGDSRTIGTMLYRMGVEGHSGSADFIVQRFVVPDSDAVLTDNPFRGENLAAPTNVSATTSRTVVADPVTGLPRTTRWVQTEANLDDPTGMAVRESARGHRGMIKGDFLALGYLWTPNWDLFMQGRDIENYYVRRSFDGGASFTTAPATAPYDGDGVRSCRYYNDPATGALLAPVCADIGPGAFEPAQNLSRLDGFDESAIEPRLQGLPGTIPGSPYPEDVQDTSVLWQAWGTALPKDAEEEGAEPDVPVPDEGSGKGPLDIWVTFSRDYGDTYYANEPMAGGDSVQAESQMRFSPDGSKMYAVWNDYGPGDLDVAFRRFMPEVFPANTVPGGIRLTADAFAGPEGEDVRVLVERVDGRRGELTVAYETADGTALAGTHYTALSGTLTFADGEVGPKAILVPTTENAADAPGVALSLRLTELVPPVADGWLDAPATATVTILDDDDHVAPQSRASVAVAATNRATIPVGYTVTDADSTVARVELWVRRPGASSFGRAMVDTVVDGRFGYVTGGVNGVYRFFTVATDASGNRESAAGAGDDAVRLDTVRPALRDASVTPTAFDISRDGFVRMRVSVGESALVRFAVVDPTGSAVRRLPAVVAGPGAVTARWYGRDDSGRLVRGGAYSLVVRASDDAGNTALRRVALPVRR